MFDKYYFYNSVSAGRGRCEKGCKAAQICGITKIDFDQYDQCLLDFQDDQCLSGVKYDQCLTGVSTAHTLNGSSLISFVILLFTSTCITESIR